MNRWRFPSLSLHGIEGAFDGPGTKTVIPSKVIGKFSIRIVPNMLPEDVHRLVKDYLQKEFDKLGSPCKLTVNLNLSLNLFIQFLGSRLERTEVMARRLQSSSFPSRSSSNWEGVQQKAGLHAWRRLNPDHSDFPGIDRKECYASADWSLRRYGTLSKWKTQRFQLH